MSPDVSSDALGDDPPVALVAVGAYPTYAAGSEHGLVVLAMGLTYWLVPTDAGGFTLMVETDAADVVRAQLADYDRESVGWPPVPDRSARARPAEFFTPLLWAASVLGGFRAQQHWPAWNQAGALDAAAVVEGREWWRVATAMFLHADLGHLVSNLMSGFFVFSAVCSTLGRRRGWLLVAVASLAANATSVAVHYPDRYVSVGASTAIFAGLGLLTGRALRIGMATAGPHRWRALFAPLAAGITVLALFGAGGQRVDVGAHLGGFLFGLVLGFATRTAVRSEQEGEPAGRR